MRRGPHEKMGPGSAGRTEMRPLSGVTREKRGEIASVKSTLRQAQGDLTLATTMFVTMELKYG